MRNWIFAVLACSLVGCAVQTAEPEGPTESSEEAVKGGKPICALKCAAPPEGCRYVDAVLTGPCHKLTCGRLVCDGMP